MAEADGETNPLPLLAYGVVIPRKAQPDNLNFLINNCSYVFFSIFNNQEKINVNCRKISDWPCSASIRRFPISSVTLADPSKTISTIVLKALAESLSVGEIKFPAALLITTEGSFPSVKSCILSTAALMANGSRTSQATG